MLYVEVLHVIILFSLRYDVHPDSEYRKIG